MRKIREVLRLKSLGHSGREIARSVSVGPTTVREYLERAAAAGVVWPVPEGMDDVALEGLLFKPAAVEAERPRPMLDCAWMHVELRKRHVTLMLLWQEYRERHLDGYQYSQFCEIYHRFTKKLSVWMRQSHRGGEKLFVDWSGDGIPWVNARTGEVEEAPLFVAVMGASSKTFARVGLSQELSEWIGCHVAAYEYFGGVPHLTVPDQPKTAVVKSCRYDPELNPTYQEMASHYGTCVMPARPRKPRDKAKVEVGVLLVQRWIIARLRDRTFYSPEEINRAIDELLGPLNARPMRHLGRSRQELFEALDRPNLLPLPEKRYEYAAWKVGARVNLDYHVEFKRHYYSVPFQHVHEEVDLRATAATVEVFLKHRRVASHVRSSVPHGYTTLAEHMPRAHREHAEWTPSRMVAWARKVGPSAAALMERMMGERAHPEQAYRACLGILRLGKHFTEERLERACARALACGNRSYRSVEAILKNGLDSQPLPSAPPGSLPLHDNVRGGRYFH